ncbi:MAG TPA: alpha-galactosidase [Prolixibacteraceae bacterium]|nr:alpha-galactosidase [Prolixibacteraceae bacterium]
MRGVFYATAVFLFLYACSPRGVVEQTEIVSVSIIPDTIKFSLQQTSVLGDIQPFQTEIRMDTLNENQYLIHLSLYTDFPSPLPGFQFRIKYPRAYIDALWSSRTWTNNSFINIPNYSRLQSDYSLISALAGSNENRVTLVSYDNFQSRYTGIDVLRESDSIVFSFNFFQHSVPDAEILEYKAQILLDFRDIHYSDVIRQSMQWRLDQEDHASLQKIDLSLLPVYSLWYPMSRNIPIENVTYYFDSISSMGFRSILFDDGWQDVVRFTVDSSGMWDPSETTVVKDFMKTVHEMDMKVALWYSKPVVGAHRYVSEKFAGRYLQYITSSQPVLDIRYPEVRDYLVHIYTSVVKEWGVDGVLFDFLNGFYPDEHIIVLEDKGRDFISVRKALDSLRTRMETELIGQNPEISLNQSYPAVGPLHVSNTQTINGFLGVTVLNDVREKLVNNRLMYGEYSPFMEVMGIHPRDPAVEVALKFHSILYGTPYVSYFSYTLSDDLRETISYWINYWKSNSEYLLYSSFEAWDPVQRYTVLKAGNETKQIITFYGRTTPFDLGYFPFETADLINASDAPQISIEGTPAGKVDYIVYNYKGVYQSRGTLKFRRNVASLDIPQGGFARLIIK